jgi:uncharacterized membrane protein
VLIEHTGRVVDAIGVFVIVFGAVIASVRFARPTFSGTDRYRTYRQDLGRAILLVVISNDVVHSESLGKNGCCQTNRSFREEAPE